MYLNGRLGQVIGPFDTKDLLGTNGAIAKFTPEITKPILTKLGIQAPVSTVVRINGVDIRIGQTGMYELDEVIQVKSLSFPNGADETTLVDFIY